MNTQELDNKMKVDTSQHEENKQAMMETTPRFTPRRFSVRGLRKHTGIKTSRTPRVAY